MFRLIRELGKSVQFHNKTHSHPARERRDDVVATPFCPSQRRRRYVSNETPNDVSVVRLPDVIKERGDNVSRVRNNDITLVRLHDVSD